MLKSVLVILNFCILVVWGCALHAATISKPYSASVPVASQSPKDRLSGFDVALKSVLIKVSGDYARIEETGVMQSFVPSERFVQTYSYRENPDYQSYSLMLRSLDENKTESFSEPVLPVVPIPADENGSQITDELPDSGAGLEPPMPFLLEVSFSQTLVDSKMVELKLPIWGETRPSVLLWVVLEEGGERTVLGTSDTPRTGGLMAIAQQRGLPLFLPVMDLEDVSAVNTDDLWGLFPGAVDQASKRYRADVAVMMRIYQTGTGSWSGNWVFKLKHGFVSGEFYDGSMAELWQMMVGDIAYRLASKYAIVKTAGEQHAYLNVEISDVATFEDYVLLQQYLRGLPPVADVELVWVSGNKNGYRITLAGTKAQFLEHLELGNRLEPDVRQHMNSSNTRPEAMQRSRNVDDEEIEDGAEKAGAKQSVEDEIVILFQDSDTDSSVSRAPDLGLGFEQAQGDFSGRYDQLIEQTRGEEVRYFIWSKDL